MNSLFNDYHLEFINLLQTFGFSISDYVTSNLVIYKTCIALLGCNKTNCSLLGNSNTNETVNLEKHVQPYADVILMTSSGLESLTSSLICILIAPWSNKYGRKPVLLVSYMGLMLYYLAVLPIILISDLSPWYIIARLLPYMISGGFSTVYFVLLMYIIDTTLDLESSRKIRMGRLYVSQSVGIFFGVCCSSFIFQKYGYTVIYSISALCMFIAFTYTLLLLPESLKINSEDLQISMGCNQFKDYFKFLTDNSIRNIIILLTICMLVIYAMCNDGTAKLEFLLFREKFKWSLTRYSSYSSIYNIANTFGSLANTFVLFKFFNIDEIAIICFGLSCNVTYFLLIGFAPSNSLLIVYTAGIINSISGILEPTSISLLSKSTSSANASNLFALVAALRVLATSGMSGPFFTFIYNFTITSTPEFYNFIAAGLISITIVLMIVAYILQKQYVGNYSAMLNNECQSNHD